MLHELFTGRPAFGAGSLPDLSRRQRETPPPPPSSLLGGVDPAVDRSLLADPLGAAPR